MADQLAGDGTPNTDHFGFTRIGPGESTGKNGQAALDADPVTLDNLLYALFTREFNGDPALGDPTDPPGVFLLAAGGALPAGTTFYYRVAFVDAYGLESAASAEASITTADTIEAPTAPALSVFDSGGSIGVGAYNYVLTQVDDSGGETTVSPLSTIAVNVGDGSAVIALDLPDLAAGATKFRVYRSRPGQTALYFLAEQVSGTYLDTGLAEDQSIPAPNVNSTNATGSVQIVIPGAFIPEQCAAWRIYRATASGDYDEASLVHHVVEPATEDSPIPTTVWTDTGADLLTGTPRETSATAPQGPKLNLDDLTGSLPLTSVPRGVRCLSTYGPGVLTDGQVLNMTESPAPVQPVRFTAFFRTAPSTSGVVTVRVSDAAGASVALQCSPSFHRAGDPAGFFRAEYPLLLDAHFEAEAGTRSSTDVLIDADLTASNSQAVSLETQGQWVQLALGTLDPGDYATFAQLRVINFDPAAPGNDLVVSVIRSDTNAVVASVARNLQSTTPGDPSSTPADFMYRELAGPSFTAPGGVPLVLRIAKATASAQAYDVDFARYAATVPTLAAGPLTVSASVAGGTTNGADVNVSLWF